MLSRCDLDEQFEYKTQFTAVSLPFQDDQIGELAEETPPPSEKVETERQEERDVDMKEAVTTQVVGKKNNLGI